MARHRPLAPNSPIGWWSRRSGTPVLDRYVFLDSRQNRLGEVAAESGYDPRERPWYTKAVAAGTTTITDPEVFWAFGLVGITVAAPFAAGDHQQGVVAADITLDSFAAYLANHRISEGSVSYLLDKDGMVLAASDGSAVARSQGDAVELHHVTAVETGSGCPGLRSPAARRPRAGLRIQPRRAATTSRACLGSTRSSASAGSYSS